MPMTRGLPNEAEGQMRALVNKSDLCEAERQLVEALHDLGFGRIEDLWVRNGKPVFDPPPRLIAMVSMKAQSSSPDQGHVRDFTLKQPVVLLLLLIREIGNGKIRVIHARHGLPINVEHEHPIGRRAAAWEQN